VTEGEISEENLRVHVAMLEGPRHPSNREALDQAADYVTGTLRRAGVEATEHEFEHEGASYHNVVGRLGRREGFDLLIAAHYDTFPGTPGADDNASGVAVMLEVARSLSTMHLKGGVEFVAFCMGEGAGGAARPGSEAYASDLRAMRLDLSSAVVLECVGFTSEQQGQPQGVELPPTGDFLAVIGNSKSRTVAEGFGDAAAEAGLRTASITVGGRGKAIPLAREGDHIAFWHHAFRAIVLTDTGELRNPHRRGETDDHETLDFAFLGRVAAGLDEFIIRHVGFA
jgi:acetylornithine deacetylase/succinyl-diaminopimelate desuccinylase-like protein